MIGQTISHYRITEKLGEGGMGVVYKAEDLKLDRHVALKFLAPHLFQEEKVRERFEREAKAAAALDHPNICHVYEIDTIEGRTFIAMAFIEGEGLDKRIGRGLKIEEALRIAKGIAKGLEATHGNGIVHRDIKPQNVIVGEDGRVAILDFGVAQLTRHSRLTRHETAVGTVAYMSPEQTEGGAVDHRTDIWSLGVVLYEMLTSQLPFRGHYDQAILYSILNEEPVPMTTSRSDVPRGLERIVLKALAKSPAARYQRVADMLSDLETANKKVEPRRLGVRWSTTSSSSQRVAYLCLALVITLASAVWFVGLRGSDPTSVEALNETTKVVPLTTYPGIEQHASFSPDGGQVAFSWNGDKQDNFDIYVKLIGPGNPIRLTDDLAEDISPVWSPDGRQIAFLRRREGAETDVLLVPALGGSETKLIDVHVDVSGEANSPNLCWSPDGRWLIIPHPSSAEVHSGLFTFSLDTWDVRRLTSPPPYADRDSQPALSSDGRTLAFVRKFSDALSHLFLLDLSEDLTPQGQARQLTDMTALTRCPVWVPDLNEIVFSAGRKGNSRLWRADALASKPPERLPTAGENGWAPVISLSGRRLAYERWVRDTDIWRAVLDPTVPRMHSPSKFIVSSMQDWNPQISPDGRKIAFASDRSGSFEIWTCDSDGSKPVQLTSFGGPETGTPRWSPDSKYIVFDSRLEGQSDIFTLNAGGGVPRRLTKSEFNDVVPSWSQDGKWVYFTSNRTGNWQIWIPEAGGIAQQLTQTGGFGPLASSDGNWVLFDPLGQGVAKVPVEGGEGVEVFQEPLSHWSKWAVAKNGIYYIPKSDRIVDLPVLFFNFLTRETVDVGRVADRSAAGFAVSPDASYVLYTHTEDRDSDLVLVEDFQ